LLFGCEQDVDGRDEHGHDDADGLRRSLSVVMAGLVPATHASLLSVSEQAFVQVLPFRIEAVNKPDLPGSRPMLHVLFFLDGIADIIEDLIVDEQLEAVPLGESVDQSLAMFEATFWKIGGNADIENAVAPIAHDVNVGGHRPIEQDVDQGSKRDGSDILSVVMAGLVPAIHVFLFATPQERRGWP
jgi:hypothetical protein